MGKIFDELGVDPRGNSNEAAQEFFNSLMSSYEIWDLWEQNPKYEQDELNFLFKNSQFFNQFQKAILWNLPAGDSTWGEAYGVSLSAQDEGVGIVNNFSGEAIPTDDFSRLSFIMFGGAYLKETKGINASWNSEQKRRNKQILQKAYFQYEKDGTVFREVSMSLKKFSFVSFKKTLSEKINAWLETDPVIEGLYSVLPAAGGGSKTLYTFRLHEPDGGETLIKLPKELEEPIEIYSGPIGQLKKRGLWSKDGTKTNYINYAKYRGSGTYFSPTNEVRVNENLESTKSTEFGNDPKAVNFVQMAYWKIAIGLLEENYAAIAYGETSKLKLEGTRKIFNDTVEIYVNKNNAKTGDGESSKGQIGYRLAQFILNNVRARVVAQLFKEYRKTGNAVKSSDMGDIFKKAEEAVKNNGEITGNDIDADELSDEEIELRQKFLKQCLLMSRLKDMQKINLKDLDERKEGTIHESVPYKGRLYLIDEKNINKDKSSIMNKLLIPNIQSIEDFVDMTTDEHAQLVPKIRLVKVYTKKGKIKEHEFVFPKNIDSTRVNNLFSTDFDRGSDFGIKQFSFSFDGSSPATAKNDIKANLVLYFQSFEDFVKAHPINKGHRYVDLLILPSKEKIGSGQEFPFQYDPSYYRIRADVGWVADSAPEHMRQAIKKINKTFYLNMIDHEIDIRDDGSVEINVSYRAYIETALKGSTLDALNSREAKRALKEVQKQYQDVLSSSSCTLEQLSTIRAQFLQIEENLRRNSMQSIISRLISNNLLKYVIVDNSAATSFRNTGFLSSPAVFTSKRTPTGDPAKEKSDPKDFIMKQNTFSDVTLSNSDSDLLINYFFLADLVYVVLDCLYDEADADKTENESYVQGTENFKFLLSSFQYIDLFNNSAVESVNIGNIPISVELFNEWYTENVIKPERTSYPVMYFIRDITKYLITDILLESCFKNDLDKNLQFKTNNFLGRRRGRDTRDPIGTLLSSQKDKTVLDVGQHYRRGSLPLQADLNGVSTSIKNLYNYIAIYAEAPRGITDKRGSKYSDELNGIMHYQLGRDRGILKKIKFSKSDMQYVREARFFRNGHDGLMQLAAVYKITMEMVGNTLYYPGMEVFIDPVGLLGAGSNFNPAIPGSIANRMGFGGYHLVTSVKSSIGPGKFTTTVEALFSYSGDGNPKSKIIGSREEIAVDVIDTKKVNEKEQSKEDQDYCRAISDNLYQQNAAIGYGYKNAYDPIDTRHPSEIPDSELTVEQIKKKIAKNKTVKYDKATDTYEVIEAGEYAIYQIVDGKLTKISGPSYGVTTDD